MNGAPLVFGLTAALAAAGALSRRGSGSILPEVYHVTTMDAARDILANGFLPGWGDLGLGVYFFGSEASARRYAEQGGWDKGLRGKHVVILAARDPRIRRVTSWDLDPSWDSSKYADMWFLAPDEGDDADEGEHVRPTHVRVHIDAVEASK
jgi:hypothetical protein